MNERKWTLFSILTLLLSAAWIWASIADPGSVTSGAIPAPRQGFLAPDFTLKMVDGSAFKLSEQRGHPILLNLWASWCIPCQSEMPAIERVYQDYRDKGFLVVGINATDQDNEAQVVKFITDKRLTFPIVLDRDGSVSHLYQLRALPTSYFIDKNGTIREVVVGGPMSESLLRSRIENLIR